MAEIMKNRGPAFMQSGFFAAIQGGARRASLSRDLATRLKRRNGRWQPKFFVRSWQPNLAAQRTPTGVQRPHMYAAGHLRLTCS
jgi:hypothetical protein